MPAPVTGVSPHDERVCLILIHLIQAFTCRRVDRLHAMRWSRSRQGHHSSGVCWCNKCIETLPRGAGSAIGSSLSGLAVTRVKLASIAT